MAEHIGVLRRKPGFFRVQQQRGCHTNDRLGDNDQNDGSTAEICHITRHLLKVMQIRWFLALVTEFSGVPA